MTDITHLLGRVHQTDCLPFMRTLPDKCVDLVVTSPPYDNLRTYNGFVFDFEGIAKELFRITKDGGVVVWVVSDAYIDGSETGTSFKQALFFMSCGFNLHDTMMWVKDGGGAIGSNKTYTQNHEYMFVFSRGIPKTINLIKDKVNLSAGQDKSGVGRRKDTGEHKVENRQVSAEFSKRNNYWYIPPEAGEHPAVFPLRLAKDHILTWSAEKDIVFDPMCGSATTLLAASLLNREFLGTEISAEYCAIAEARIEAERRQGKLF